MANFSVTTSVQELTDVPSVIQNLGTGNLYVDIVSTVSSTTSIKLTTGQSIPVGGGHTYYGVSDGTADVRVLPGGMSKPG